MNSLSFDEFSRQSPKGIIINYGVLLYKLVKSFWVLIILVISRDIENKLNYILGALGILGFCLCTICVFCYVFIKYLHQ